ncbi:HAD-IA family hydrolase [Leifsonia sp. 21MFCrub1.1]|uniref:HAD-IA family hydrolase n=1 Tax=Leifsonia sp. 21MFCrub1.1 TaxID=1798223 RepID=UPI00089292C8|nr:HAD-IA family hydrolase [Leifsonia sp. 21MFCrub1.1]SEA35361.1 haloacid dehalogenase superfamily, subfamily IA, variant 3 with third motif having DD or ED/beta-phosphoglucomutase family hydrolase [Leifsonia sp. 21MFCrub1.1]
MEPLPRTPAAAVVLDMDGVVTDTRAFHLRAWTQLFDEELGAISAEAPAFTTGDYERSVDGRSRESGIRAFLASRRIPESAITPELVSRLAERKQHIFEQLIAAHGTTTLPGASRVIRALHSAGVRLALATASRNVGLVLESTGILPLFDAVVDGAVAADLSLPSKPDPALFVEACRRLGVAPAHAMLVEDSEAGIEAAAAAGFGLVMGIAPDPRRAAALRRADADVVVPGLDALEIGPSGEIFVTGAPDPWVLGFDGFDPEAEPTRESICALANGYWGTRAAAEDGASWAGRSPGTYFAGVYDAVVDGPSTGDEIVNAPDWLPLALRPADGGWLTLDGEDLIAFRQELDLRQAVLRRTLTYHDRSGRETRVRFRRIVSQADPRMSALQATVVAVDWSGPLTIRTGIDAGTLNTITDTATPGSGPGPRRHVAIRESRELSPDAILVEVETLVSHVHISVAERTRVHHGDATLAPEREFATKDAAASHEFTIDLEQGRPVVIEKIVAVATSRDRAILSPSHSATTRLARAPRFADLLADHAQRWEALWPYFSTSVEPAADLGLAVNVNTFHLLQTLAGVTTELDVGVPARGLHGEGYGGRVFWDELFVYPVLTLRRPDISRTLLGYRHRRLPEAEHAAAEAARDGAMFPWQSATTGADVTPDRLFNPLTGRWMADHSHLQRHVGLGIAYSAWEFYETTGDTEYLAEEGAELIVGVARFFASLADWDQSTGRYSIRGVMGPDEFHDGPPGAPGHGVTDNVYTNVMTAWVLLRAADTARLLSSRPDRGPYQALGITSDELDRWAHIAKNLRIVFNADGTLSQFDGYDALEPIDLDRYRSRYPTEGRLDLVLDAEGDSTNRYQVSKQPDSLMLLYLLSAEELRELLGHMGYPLSADAVVRTVERYSRSSTYGSTLSNVVHSWLEARRDRERSWAFLERALQSDIADIQGGTTRYGIHLAAMAGSVDLLTRCYTGIETRADMLWFHPLLPAEIDRLEFTISYRAHRLSVSITHESLGIVSADGYADPIHIVVEGEPALLHTGETRTFEL